MSHSPSADLSETGLDQTAVIIPARNEERSIGLVLQGLPRVALVIVVDNGSSDRTAIIAQEAGSVVVRESVAGYGRACLAGMEELRTLVEDRFPQIQYVAFIDGDYSDHGEELLGMLQTLEHQQADFVLGSRILGDREQGAMPIQAMLGNH